MMNNISNHPAYTYQNSDDLNYLTSPYHHYEKVKAGPRRQNQKLNISLFQPYLFFSICALGLYSGKYLKHICF